MCKPKMVYYFKNELCYLFIVANATKKAKIYD